jgi:threonine dehydrogenase-like Zn-dependent dehydrogenase
MFFSHVHLHRGPAGAPTHAGADRPDLERQINPGRVFDLELPLEEAAAGYQAMDSRQAIKVLLRP